MNMNSFKKTMAGLALSLSIVSFAVPAHAAEAGTYVTQNDDTFWTVSQKLHIPLQQLLDANPSINPLNVYGGLTMKLPGATETKVESASITPANSVQTVSGGVLRYSKEINVVATAYSDAASENGGYGAVDYFGNPLKVGTIAVDPNVIPLGTKVYVKGLTYNGLPTGFVATASDVGGAIKGNRIDIFIPRSMGNVDNFGMQNVSVYLLK